ncbi:GDP-mannose 4,6-dehydratase [Candidatus Bathyarchaeota archaeon]|nr:GDP-mannose 4,6-dehydratase [Candidatus Bathyarchaeota archaeon]MBS7627969.1 GDP-mannose 4,6-dehydratase [Candidatus Bathyarchaeota archaeon]
MAREPRFAFIKGDLSNPSDTEGLMEESYGLVFHLAANPEVRISLTNPDVHFQQNIVPNYNLLEALEDGWDGDGGFYGWGDGQSKV